MDKSEPVTRYVRKKPELKIVIPDTPLVRKAKPIHRKATPRYLENKKPRVRRLKQWEIVDYIRVYPKTAHYAIGYLDNGRSWQTADIKRMEIDQEKIRLVTVSGTIYALYHSEANAEVTNHIFLTS